MVEMAFIEINKHEKKVKIQTCCNGGGFFWAVLRNARKNVGTLNLQQRLFLINDPIQDFNNDKPP